MTTGIYLGQLEVSLTAGLSLDPGNHRGFGGLTETPDGIGNPKRLRCITQID